MLLAPLLPPTLTPPSAGGAAALIRESGKAIKDVKEGEVDLITTGVDGTTTMRILGSESKDAFRFTILQDGKPTYDMSSAQDKATVVDHANRRVIQNWDFKAALTKTEEKKITDADVAPGNVSITLDPGEGFVVHANPGLENVRRWRSGDEELITGDFGSGGAKRGSFQWVRNAKTKMPETFTGTMDDHKLDVRFKVKARKVGWSELLIPAEDYKGYAPAAAP